MFCRNVAKHPYSVGNTRECIRGVERHDWQNRLQGGHSGFRHPSLFGGLLQERYQVSFWSEMLGNYGQR